MLIDFHVSRRKSSSAPSFFGRRKHLMAKCKFVVTLIKDGAEDDFLRETWKSINILRSTYIFHANQLRKKRNSKLNKARETRLPTTQPTATGQTQATSTQVANSSRPLLVTGSKPASSSEKKKERVVLDLTNTTTSKTWVDIVSPTKSQPSYPPGVDEKATEERKKPVSKPEKEKKMKKKISLSSSEDLAPEKPPQSKKTRQVSSEEPLGLYRKWIRDFGRMGANISQIKDLDLEGDDSQNFYVVWEGRTCGIFLDWNTCSSSVTKYRGAKFRKVVGTVVDALKYFKEKTNSDV